MKEDTLLILRDRLRELAEARDWDQFHSPKNLSMALIVEAGELVEHFQWVTEDQSHQLAEKELHEVEQELADILIYLIRLADKLNVGLAEAASRKVAINERKYPANRVRGSAKKYTNF